MKLKNLYELSFSFASKTQQLLIVLCVFATADIHSKQRNENRKIRQQKVQLRVENKLLHHKFLNRLSFYQIIENEKLNFYCIYYCHNSLGMIKLEAMILDMIWSQKN